MKHVNTENGFYKLLAVQPDKFYPTVFKAQNFEAYLTEQLKKNGYDHVIFIQNRKGAFSVEGDTDALSAAGLQARSQSQTAKANLGIPVKKKPEPSTTGEQVVRKTITFAKDSEFYSIFVRLLRKALTNPEKRVAVVIPKIFFTSFMGLDDEKIKTRFYRELAEISHSRLRNGSIFITFSEKEHQDLFLFHDMQYREAFPEFQKISQEDVANGRMMERLQEVLGRNLQVCGYPAPKEVANMLVKNQLDGKINLKYRLLNDLSSFLAEFIRSGETRSRFPWIRFDVNMPLYSLEKSLMDAETFQKIQDHVEASENNGRAWEILTHTRGMEDLVEVMEKLEEEYHSLKNGVERKTVKTDTEDRFETEKAEHVPLLMNLAIVGPPGVGKTFAARLVVESLYEKKMLPTRIFKETSVGQMIGSHIGESEKNTRELFQAALGGVLFIDEAYQLDYTKEAKNGHSFKKDIVDLLLKLMYDYRGQICVIFAGYKEPVEKMINSVEGFASRFKYIVELKPYTYQQLTEISRDKLRSEEISLDGDVNAIWPDFIRNWMSERRRDGEREYANFRTFEEEFFNVLVKSKDKDRVIRSANIPEELKKHVHPYVPMSVEQVDQLFEGFYGMEEVKKAAKELVEGEENRRKNPVLYKKKDLPNMVFLGPPGTGKTETAALFGKVAGMAGSLEIGRLVEVRASDFIKGRVGEGSEAMEQIFHDALDSVLLIDELGSLCEMPADERKTLLQLVNRYQERMIVILTGYAEEYDRLCSIDGGYIRRFQKVHYFRMYTADEMTEIMKTVMNRGEQVTFIFTEEARQAVWRYFWAALRKKGRSFGNGSEALNCKQAIKDAISRANVVKEGETIEITADFVQQAVYRLTGMEFEVYCEGAPEFADGSHENQGISGMLGQSLTADMVSTAVPKDTGTETEDDPNFIRDAARAVLFLEMETDRGQAYGTGFLIHEDGYAITCNHCVESVRSMKARLRIKDRPGGQDSWHKVQVLNTNPDTDLALIKLEGSHFPVVSLRGPEEPVAPMEKTLLLGYPFGAKTQAGITSFSGRIASVDPQQDKGGELLLLNSEAKSGNSGSPVFGADGRVLGILLGSMTEQSTRLTEEINFIRPVKYIFRHLIQ